MFDLDAVADEEAKTPYTFRADGKRWRLPHAGADLTVGQQLDLDRGRIVDVVATIAERWDEEAGEWVADGRGLAQLLRSYKPSRVGKMQAAWLTQAGMEPGESGASSPS